MNTTLTAKTRIPEDIERYLLTSSEENFVSIADFIERGGQLVTPDAIRALASRLPGLRRKIAGIRDSDRLKERVQLLLGFFEESFATQSTLDDARREITFALLYFLKGFDRIPDSIPEIGLLDDAIIVNNVLQRHRPTLRVHWVKRGRVFPDDL